MSSELVERLKHAHQHSQQRVLGSHIFGEAAARIEALEAENARKDEALKRVEWALTKQSLTDKERVQDALSVARRAREGGNADG